MGVKNEWRQTTKFFDGKFECLVCRQKQTKTQYIINISYQIDVERNADEECCWAKKATAGRAIGYKEENKIESEKRPKKKIRRFRKYSIHSARTGGVSRFNLRSILE